MPVPIIAAGAAAVAARLAAKKAAAKIAKSSAGSLGNKRKKVSDSAAKAISKEMNRPPNNARRARKIPKPSTQSLTPREKLYETLGKKAKVTTTQKRPMKSYEIKEAARNKREKIIRNALTIRKPIGTTITKPSQRPQLPKHKTILKISREKIKPEINDPIKNAAQDSRNSFAVKPKSTIYEQRGNTLQPPSITKSSDSRILRKERVGSKKTQQRTLEKLDRRRQARDNKLNPNRVDSPRNQSSNAVIMKDRVKKGLEESKKVNARLNASKKIKAEKDAIKVDKTLADAKKAREQIRSRNPLRKPLIPR